LIIEVLSPSTAAYDRGDKFKAYRSLPSFQEYWLVDQYQMQIDQYCKTDDDTWLYRSYEDPQAIITSPTLGLEMAIAVAYEDVAFDQEHGQD
ncbi:MAG: Uma2 family endonuclease, partial [Synechocystis sp.]|nr:Uma2 family endonuclease [Synechocystis sp.]